MYDSGVDLDEMMVSSMCLSISPYGGREGGEKGRAMVEEQRGREADKVVGKKENSMS